MVSPQKAQKSQNDVILCLPIVAALAFSVPFVAKQNDPPAPDLAQSAQLNRDFFARDTVAVARALLGQRLVRILPDGTRLAGTILETEAYLGPHDEAAHSHNWRRTDRTEPMWMAPGTSYVFLTYGMHHCLNVSTARAGLPQAVLIRSIEPTQGVDIMQQHRGPRVRPADLCNGPAKLTQALAIDRSHDRLDLTTEPTLFLEKCRSRSLPKSKIIASPRVGIDYAGAWVDKPLRMSLRDHPGVSRPRPT